MDISSLKPNAMPICIDVDANGELWLVVNGDRKNLLEMPTHEKQVLFVSALNLVLLLRLGLINFAEDFLMPYEADIAEARNMLATMGLDEEQDEFEAHLRKMTRSLCLIEEFHDPQTSFPRKEAIIERLSKFQRAEGLVADLKATLPRPADSQENPHE